MARSRARGTRNAEGRMRLGEHLVELRRRLMISGAAILLCTIAGFFVVDWLLEVLEARHVPRQALTLGLESLAVAVDDIAGARRLLLAASFRVSA